MVRSPLSLQKLVYLDGQRAVLYHSTKMNPSLGRNFEAMDQADPLRCRRCGGKLRVVAYLSDPIVIRRVLEELGLSPPQKPKPPPAPSEVVSVPVDEEGREIAAP